MHDQTLDLTERPARTSAESDPLLVPYLTAREESTAESALADLLTAHVYPVVRAILRARVGSSHQDAAGDIEDLEGRSVVLLIARLRLWRTRPEGAPVRDFRAYVATTTYRAYYDYLRDRHPERHRLKNRVRYLLTHDARFALWQDAEDRSWSALAAWPRGSVPPGRPAIPLSAVPVGARDSLHSRRQLAEVTAGLLREAGRPVELDELVGLLSSCDEPAHHRAFSPEVEERRQEIASTAPLRQADDRIFLKELWAEICRLPRHMRTVLLLNLRDPQGRDLIGLLPATGTATLRAIAGALEMPLDELARIWNDLPFDDRTIAERMSIERQSVVNLRAAARRRLNRRLRPA